MNLLENPVSALKSVVASAIQAVNKGTVYRITFDFGTQPKKRMALYYNYRELLH